MILIIGIALGLEANQIIVSANFAYDVTMQNPYALLIIGYILDLSGVFLLVFGFKSKNPPVHQDNNF